LITLHGIDINRGKKEEERKEEKKKWQTIGYNYSLRKVPQFLGLKKMKSQLIDSLC
jgi:dTDP-4-amino-4,6-dideoxygalactose transaminase